MENAEKIRRAISESQSIDRRQSDSRGLFVVAKELSPLKKHPFDQAGDIVVDIERQISLIRQNRKLDLRAGAEEIFAVVRQLLRRLTGYVSVDQALQSFVVNFWIDSATDNLLHKIVRDCRAVLHPAAGPLVLQRFSAQECLSGLSYILERLSTRFFTMSLLSEEEPYAAAALRIKGILHDQVYLGVSGLLVVAAARLEGFEFQSQWIKLDIYAAGNPVSVRPGWEAWGEGRAKCEVESRADGAPEENLFVSLMPLAIQSQRCVLDDVRLFVPYAALDLERVPRQQIDCEISLVNAAGLVLCADAQSAICAIPTVVEAEKPVPSPGVLGFWRHNVCTGDAIDEPMITQVRRISGKREIHEIEVCTGAVLCDLEGQDLSMELRILSVEGYPIESELHTYMATDHSFLLQKQLMPHAPIVEYPGLHLVVPLVALEIDPGMHDLFFELVILDRQNRIVCGSMARKRIHIPQFDLLAGDRNDENRPMTLDSSLVLTELAIDAGADFNGANAIRVDAFFADFVLERDFCGIEITLTSADDMPIAYRGIGLDREPNKRELHAVFVIEAREIAVNLPLATDLNKINVLLEVRDRRKHVLLTNRREVPMVASFIQNNNLATTAMYPAGEVEIADLQVLPTALSDDLQIVVYANIDLSRVEGQSYVLHFEAQSVSANSFVSDATSDGYSIALEMPKVSHFSSRNSPIQISQQIRLPRSLSARKVATMDVTLYAPSGRLLHGVTFSLERGSERIHHVQ